MSLIKFLEFLQCMMANHLRCNTNHLSDLQVLCSYAILFHVVSDNGCRFLLGAKLGHRKFDFCDTRPINRCERGT